MIVVEGKESFSRFFKKKIIIILFSLLFFSGLAFLGGIFLSGLIYKTDTGDRILGKISTHYTTKELRELLIQMKGISRETPANIWNGFWATPDTIFLDIKHVNVEKLQAKRNQAIERGFLFTASDDFVKASIRLNKGNSVPVKIRLKGDTTDHLEGEHWSLRVHLKGDRTLFGMKRFSLHHPRTRSYMLEWFYHEVMRDAGIIALRYKFVNVVINGKSKGIYALEESFAKRLVENNQRREGILLKFFENRVWEEAYLQGRFGKKRNGTAGETTSEIDTFETGKLFADPKKKEVAERGMTLLELFRRGNITASEAFDLDKMTTFMALTDLLGAEHGSRYHNARFYYNPVNSKLEPISFDASISTKSIDRLLWQYDNYYYQRFFEDLEFTKMYFSKLEKFSDREVLNNIFEKTNEARKENLAYLNSSYPFYYFPKDTIIRNWEYVQSKLNPSKGIHAYIAPEKPGYINVAAIHDLPIEVLIGDTAFLLESKKMNTPLQYRYLKYADKINPEKDQIRYRILGTKRELIAPIFSYPPYLQDVFDQIKKSTSQASKLTKFPFIRPEGNKIFFKQGNWKLTEQLIIPKGYEVIIPIGTKIDLLNRSSILSYSKVTAIGTKDNPIEINSSDKSGEGIVVLNANGMSKFTYVHFKNLRSMSKVHWPLTGSVTLYESDVHFRYCLFADNNSEDSLNIFRSSFLIEDSHIKNTFSDAFDADFSNGTVNKTTFENLGNDALDFSGSEVEIKNVKISKAQDKALSVGEASTIKLHNIDIIDSEMAVVSKDSSSVKGNNIDIKNVQLGIVAYKKKPEFTNAVIDIENVTMKNITKSELIEEGSQVRINNTQVIGNLSKVEELLYGNQFGKKTVR